MICTINWNTLSIEEWEKRFSQVPRSNVIQSYTYARAACPQQKQKARWGLIFIDGREAGLVQIFEAGILWNAVHAVIIDRGPLWFPGFGNAMHVKVFFNEMHRQFPPRLGRRRRFFPEILDGPAARKMMDGTGLKVTNDGGYQTIWLDLTPSEEVLRSALKSKWRGWLGKGERSDLKIKWIEDAQCLPQILSLYAADKMARGYAGPSPALLKAYVPLLAGTGNLLIGQAFSGGDLAAFVVLASHGRSATYLIGWNSSVGREKAAHHVLLWQGALVLQQKGIKELDLGGVNDDSAEGVKIFKEGLGGESVRYVGRYT